MSGLRRATPAKQILELARRLAEDYDSIPLPEISRVVQEAADTVHARGDDWTGTATGVPTILEIVEILAREDLDVTRSDQARRQVRPERARSAQPAARRRTPHQGAE